MSILSKVASIAAKYAPKALNYSVRAIKATPKLLFGTNIDTVGSAMRTAFKGTSGSIWASSKNAIKAGGRVLESGANGKAFWKTVGKESLDLFKLKPLIQGWKVGARAATIAGKNSFLGGLKGLGKNIAKKMPLIGTLFTLVYELYTNILPAAKDRGSGEALKETGKAVARLIGGAAFAAIGAAICPGLIGPLAGWLIGEALVGKVTGGTYSERKDEAVKYLTSKGLTEDQLKAAEEQGTDLIAAADKLKETEKNAGNSGIQQQQQPQQQQQQRENQGATLAQNPDPYGIGAIIRKLNNTSYMPSAGYGISNPYGSYSIPDTYTNMAMQYPQFNHTA